MRLAAKLLLVMTLFSFTAAIEKFSAAAEIAPRLADVHSALGHVYKVRRSEILCKVNLLSVCVGFGGAAQVCTGIPRGG